MPPTLSALPEGTLPHPEPPSPTLSSPRSSRHVPLLSLAQPAVALGESLTLGEPGDDGNVGEIWNVITRAADLVKDGERLENLAWRHWGQPKRSCFHDRRTSISSAGTASTTDLYTPLTEHSSYSFPHSRSIEKRTFGGALKLLLEDNSNFKDWVTDAKQRLPVPILSVPDTPVPNVEIRLVEPTPVPSRVGSLGASLATGGLLGAADVPPKLEEEEEVIITEEPASISTSLLDSTTRSRSPRKRGKFFVHSSPSKGSGSDTSHPSQPSPAPTAEKSVPSPSHLPRPTRKSSGSSSAQGEMTAKPKKTRINDVVDSDGPPRRNVSLSTMRGRFTSEKRKAAEAIAAKEEDSGWEDEVENWADEPAETKDDVEEEGDWSDEAESPEKPKQRRSSSRSKSAKSSSNLDLNQLLARPTTKRSSSRQTPPPPAPTPLKKMSKKERLAAAAERAWIEAELDAQQKREMFAKKQIFGKAPGEATGLLTGLFKRGGSMVDLTQTDALPLALRPSPTHGHLPSLSQSHKPAPNLLRSKSAVAMPIQTGVSVTISPHGAIDEGEHSKKRSNSKGGKGSQERRPPTDVELESSGEESDVEDTYLANSQTQRKLDELVAKKAKVQPVAAPGVRFDDNGVVQPISPTTRRRAIIMREMSESLRRNLILEREKSSGGPKRNNSFGQPHSRPPPSTHTSVLPARGSAVNLQTYNIGSGPAVQPPQLARQQTNVLGGGFLRPLTRVGQGQIPQEERMIGRTQSSATLSGSGTTSPRSPADPTPPEGLAMVRSSTDGDGRIMMEREARRRELTRRTTHEDTGYRAHGW